MPSRTSTQCTTRRKHSLGKLRRAHPASGATWNVQVVRGKMSSKCLWHACRALILGIILMLLGAGMATVGYYADQLSVGSEIRGNSTIRIKNETKGFHLNNLSYVGPIVMGFGGFIVVASCVMTFEARDSAAKVVPARLKATSSSKTNLRSNSSSATSQRRANDFQRPFVVQTDASDFGIGAVFSQEFEDEEKVSAVWKSNLGVSYQNTRWDHHLGVFRSAPVEPPQATQVDRQALTAALIHFSKTLGYCSKQPDKESRLTRSGSVPSFSEINTLNQTNIAKLAHLLSPSHKPSNINLNSYRRHRHHHHHTFHQGNTRYSRSRSPRLSASLIQRPSRESASSLVQSMPFQKHYWNALSVDETDFQSARIFDRNKRSDTAKRHVLSRQKPIENEDLQSVPIEERRRSFTLSEFSCGGRWTNKASSVTSRTTSIDSKHLQVDLHSPESQRSRNKISRRLNSGPSSTPSVEREFRSQLSICSEPIAVRQFSGQSSIEPCLLEESTENDEKRSLSDDINSAEVPEILKKTRPESLHVEVRTLRKEKYSHPTKLLYRSSSSLTFYRPRPKITGEHDSSFFMKKHEKHLFNHSGNELYDSVQVINERRKKILKAESDTTLLEKQYTDNFKNRLEIFADEKINVVNNHLQNTK